MKRGDVKKIVIGVIAIAVIITALSLFYFSYITSEKCADFECFQENMKQCTRASYINEKPEASWGYSIIGRSGGECTVNVEMLQAKKGELGIDKLNGYEMLCFHPYGEAVYPEEDLSKCHGRLKEELQTVIINKLHSYILENIGDIDKKIDEAF